MKLSKFIPVAFVLALIFSCKKDNNNGSAPTEQAYLPATFKLTVSDGSFANYELTYNDDNSVATLTSSMSTSEGEIDTAHFSHNANGDCVKVTFTNNMGLVGGSDSLVYRDGKMIILLLDNVGMVQDSTVFTFNSQGDVIMMGNKDTVRNGDSKSLYYTEFSIINGNPQTFTTYSYYAASATTQPQITNFTSNYAYDNKSNAFQAVFRADPILVYLLSNSALAYISMGKNNITGITQSDSQYVFALTYDTVTGYLSSQQTTFMGTTLTIDYTYVKSK